MNFLEVARAFEAGDFAKLAELAERRLAQAPPQRNVTARRENGRRRPRGYADWRPQAKTRALLADIEGVLIEYADYLPLSVRQIFYRLVATKGYEKTEQAYNRLTEALVRARRARLIDFDLIRDDGVVTTSQDCYASPDAFWDATGERINGYRRDRQEGQPLRIELWCEAAGMLGQLDRIAANYSTPVYSAGGFVSLTGIRGIAARAVDRLVPTVLLHVGDHDPSGESIFEAMAADAAAFVEEDRIIQTLRIEPVRVALTAEQVVEHDLPTAPAKASDKRSASWEGGTCQLEALPPDLLATIVENAIREHVDLPRWEQQLEAEREDVAELRGLLPGPEARS